MNGSQKHYTLQWTDPFDEFIGEYVRRWHPVRAGLCRFALGEGISFLGSLLPSLLPGCHRMSKHPFPGLSNMPFVS